MNEITLDLTFPTIIDILSISTTFALGLLFITSKKENRKANLFLGFFLWSLGTEVLGSFIGSNELSFNITQTSLFTIVLLLLYVIATLNQKVKKWVLFLFIPGVLANFISEDNSFFKFFEYAFNISLLLYILRILSKHKEKVTNYYSDIENKTLSWIKTIVYIFLFFHVLWIIEDIAGVFNEDILEYFAFASNILTFFMIYWIGYNGFSQSEIFTSSLFLTDKKDNSISLQTEDTSEKFKEINSIILKEKLFTNTDLNLTTLSNQLNLKEKELSKLINIHTKSNFYQFINHFRIEEFKKLLSSPKAKQLSLLGLANEAGFSSKSTFYSAFKTSEGITPKQYQIQLKSLNNV